MPTILVVDDEPGLRVVLSNILKSENYNVLTAEDGNKAIATVKQVNPDTILLDIRLPDMDGLQILEEVKKINPGIPVIMCSGFSDVESAVETVKKGAFDYISKPFKREEVLKAVQKALEARKRPAVDIPTVLPKETVEIKPAKKTKPVNILPVATIVAGILLVVIVGGIIVKNITSTKSLLYSTIYSNPTALLWDGKNLWVSDWVKQSIYKHNIDVNLSIISIFSLTGSHITGIAYDGQYLWTSDSWTKKIYKRNIDSNLNEIVSYPSPGQEPTGLYWDGVNLWCSDSRQQKIYKIKVSASGISIEKEYPSPCVFPVGMFMDKKYFWIADSETNKIFQLNIKNDFSLENIYTFSEYETTGNKLAGMTYDGKYIWTCSDGSQKIFRHTKSSLKKIR